MFHFMNRKIIPILAIAAATSLGGCATMKHNMQNVLQPITEEKESHLKSSIEEICYHVKLNPDKVYLDEFGKDYLQHDPVPTILAIDCHYNPEGKLDSFGIVGESDQYPGFYTGCIDDGADGDLDKIILVSINAFGPTIEGELSNESSQTNNEWQNRFSDYLGMYLLLEPWKGYE
jgi:hypothetical protein